MSVIVAGHVQSARLAVSLLVISSVFARDEQVAIVHTETICRTINYCSRKKQYADSNCIDDLSM